MNQSKKTLILIFVIIVSLDLLTKILVYKFLPFLEDVYLWGDKISFYSIYNTGSSDTQIEYLIRKTGLVKNNVLFWVTLNWILFSIYILLVDKIELAKNKKWLLLIPLFIINFILLFYLKGFSETPFSNHFVSWFSKIGFLCILSIIMYFTKEKWTNIFLICIISATFGNLLSHFYPPFHIIDFISIKGTYKLIRLGIFNIADLILYLSMILLIILKTQKLIKKYCLK